MSHETWLVVHRWDKPNMIVGPFATFLEAIEFHFADDFDFDSVSFVHSLAEAQAERDREWTARLAPPAA